ncbi:MAG: CAP domain-containing protein [Bacteroidia bacterium]
MNDKVSCINLIFLLFFVSSLCAQQSGGLIVLTKIDFNLIESAYTKKLNELRKKQGCTELLSDHILKKAGKDQADYMLKNNFLTHSQKSKEKETPQKRVFYYKGRHDLVGENCIKIYLNRPSKVKYSKVLITVTTYEEAAEALYQGWKNSPGHYKNMIDKEYDLQGMGFAFGKDSSVLYVSQVFSAKPFVPPSGCETPEDAFHILPKSDPVCNCFESKDGNKIVGEFQVGLWGDSVIFRFEDLPLLKRFFNDPKDAVYFDLVLREQFVCEKNNLLDGSPLYDWVMLKPVLFSEIFKKNLASDEKNLYAQIGIKIPPYFKGKHFGLNYALVKKGYSCKYEWPHIVPSDDLEILTLYPKWLYERNVIIPPDTFKGQLTFVLPFERGKTVLAEEHQKEIRAKLLVYNPFIKKIEIKTYSSIEGSTSGNIKLQEKRADEISKMLLGITTKLAETTIESKENWDDFYKQIAPTKFQYLEKLPKDSVKKILQKKIVLDSLDFLLRKTRVANIVIDVETTVDNSSSAYLILSAYKKALQTGDSLKAFRCQQRLLQAAFDYQFHKTDILLIDPPIEKRFLPVWSNYLALAVQDTEMIDSHNLRAAALTAARIDPSFKPIQFNFCLLALKYLYLYEDTLIPVKQLENKMLSCYKMSDSHLDSILVNHMLLNFSILSVFKHWEKHQYDKIDKYLLNIKKYYPGAQITEYEALRLGLLFNRYARYTWTNELLLPYMKKNTNNEELVFLFIQTYDEYHGSIKNSEWENYLTKARLMNPNRFYNWIDGENFQYLRMPAIKKTFCEIKK